MLILNEQQYNCASHFIFEIRIIIAAMKIAITTTALTVAGFVDLTFASAPTANPHGILDIEGLQDMGVPDGRYPAKQISATVFRIIDPGSATAGTPANSPTGSLHSELNLLEVVPSVTVSGSGTAALFTLTLTNTNFPYPEKFIADVAGLSAPSGITDGAYVLTRSQASGDETKYTATVSGATDGTHVSTGTVSGPARFEPRPLLPGGAAGIPSGASGTPPTFQPVTP